MRFRASVALPLHDATKLKSVSKWGHDRRAVIRMLSLEKKPQRGLERLGIFNPEKKAEQ